MTGEKKHILEIIIQGGARIMGSFICAIFGPPINASYCLVSTHQAQVSNNMAATDPLRAFGNRLNTVQLSTRLRPFVTHQNS